MSPYTLLKSPPAEMDPQLDLKAEYLDKDGVLRRSSSVTHRMIQRGVSIEDAADLDELDTFQEEENRVSSNESTVHPREEAADNIELEDQVKVLNCSEETQVDVNQRAAQQGRRYEELQKTLHDLGDLVDVTEDSTVLSPSKTNTYIDLEGNLRRRAGTYIDQEGNFRRRTTTPAQQLQETHDDFVPGPATPPAPAIMNVGEPHEYC